MDAMQPRGPATHAAWTRVDALCADPRFRDCVWRHFRYGGPSARIERLSTVVHPKDQMLHRSLGAFDVNRALSQYFSVALQQHHAAQQVLRALYGDRACDVDVLDFACGYGRAVRFLVLAVPGTRIWAADVQREAVEFVTREFGVHGIASSTDPGQFVPARRFGFVWVASLFSHLPERTFHAWLRRLLALLEPDGVLCFSVHDASLLPASAPMPADGFQFVPESENASLDKNEYGTTFVTEGFVRASLVEAAGPDRPWLRVPLALAGHQDLYVVSGGARGLEALSGFRRGPWGFVDRIDLSPSRDLRLEGWAASLDDGALDAVEIRVDGAAYRCPITLARVDVGAALGDARLALSGWEFHTALPRTESFVEVAAATSRGESALLYAGPL